MSSRLSTAIRLGLNADEARQELDRLTGQFGAAGSRMQAALGGVSAGTIAIAAGAAAATTAVVALGLEAAKAARATELAFAEVRTIADQTAFPLERIQELSRSLAVSYGTDITAQAKGLYQAISAGATSGAQATEFLVAANDLAVGGIAGTEVAIDGLTSVVNAYAGSNLSATDAADALFTAVRFGKTTVDELSGSIGQVAPIAAQVGLSFDELAAATATLTTNGVATAEAVTQLRSLLVSLIAPKAKAATAAKALGIEYNLAALRSRGLQGFLQYIADSGASEEQLAQLTGRVEGLSAVLGLSAQGGTKFAAALDAFAEKAGAASDAADIIGQTTQRRIEEIGAIMSVVLDRVGTFLNQSAFIQVPLAIARDFARGLAVLTGGLEDVRAAQQEANREASKSSPPDLIAQIRREEEAREAAGEAAEKQARGIGAANKAQREALLDAPFRGLDQVATTRALLGSIGVSDEQLEQLNANLLRRNDLIEAAERRVATLRQEQQRAAAFFERVARSTGGNAQEIANRQAGALGLPRNPAELERLVTVAQRQLGQLRRGAASAADAAKAFAEGVAAPVATIVEIRKDLEEASKTESDRIRERAEKTKAQLEQAFALLGVEVPVELVAQVGQRADGQIAELRARLLSDLAVANDDPAAQVRREEQAKLEALRAGLEERLVTEAEAQDLRTQITQQAASERIRIEVDAARQVAEDVSRASLGLLNNVISFADARAAREVAALERTGASEQQVAALRDKIQAEAFERQKIARYAEAVVSTAAGVARAFADYPFPVSAAIGGIVAAAGGVQVATIASQEYSGAGGGASAPSVGGSIPGSRSNFGGPDQRDSGGGQSKSLVINNYFASGTSSRRAAREQMDSLRRVG